MKKLSIVLLAGLLLLAVWALSGVSTQAAPRPTQSHSVRVPSTEVNALRPLALSPKVSLDYGSFRWLELSEADFAKLSASDVAFTEDGDAGKVQVRQFVFNPLVEGEPALPEALQAKGDEAGFHLIQFVGPTQDAWLATIEQSGLPILQYYPYYTYLTWGTPSQLAALGSQSFVRWQGAFHPAYKMNADLLARTGRIENITVMFYNDGRIKETLTAVAQLGGTIIQSFPAQPDHAFYQAIIQLDASQLDNLARLNPILSFGYASPVAGLDDEMSDQIMAGNHPGGTPVTGYSAYLSNLGYDGTGVRWAIIDTGVDYDHPDLSSHIVGGHDFPGACSVPGQPGSDCPAPNGGHGTHVAGIVGGDATAGFTDANGFLYGLGVAPNYEIFAMNSLSSETIWPPTGGWQEHSKQAILGQAIGGNNSWNTGEGANHGYQDSERTHDLIVRDGNFDTNTVAEPFIEVFSAGNSGPGSNTLTAPHEAKNLIAIASSVNFRAGNINTISSFSSRGPSADGRYVPTVTTPGEQIASTRNDTGGACATAIPGTNNLYAFCSGTSMASPHASGAVVLTTQWWREFNGGANPSPAMAKALLVNGAVDMGTPDIPNFNEGWGRVNVTNIISPSVYVIYRDQLDVLQATGQQLNWTIGVPDPSKPLKVTIAWTDAPGAVGANPALVNNLNLTVVNNNNTYLGNVFSGGWSTTGGVADTRNNLENIYIQNPGPNATITIDAANIAGDGIPYNGDLTDQDMVLVCSNCSFGAGFTLTSTPNTQAICAPSNANYVINVGSVLGFSDPVTLSLSGNPAGTSANFTVNPVTPPGNSTLTIGNTVSAVAGNYSMSLVGIAPTQTHTITLGLDVYTAAPNAPILSAPSNGATNIPVLPTFAWSAVAGASGYFLEVATDAGFNNVVYSTTVATNSHALPAINPLNYDTVYHWRVSSENLCGSTTSSVFTFATIATPSSFCNTPNLVILDNSTASDSMAIPLNGNLLDMNVSINATHTWVGDLSFTLTHDNTNTSVTVIDRPGTTGTGAGCSANDVDVEMDDEGADGPVEGQCSTTPPALFGSPTPNNPLSAFDGEDLNGGWTLSVTDSAGGDTGVVNEWCLLPVYEIPQPTYEVALSGNDTTSGWAGTAVSYTLTVINTGDLSDTIGLAASGNTWTTTFSQTSVFLLPGDSTTVDVMVDIPANAVNGDTDIATITATSQGDPNTSDTADLTTIAIAPVYGVVLSEDSAMSGWVGTPVTYTLWVTNTGNITDTYDLSPTGSTWTTTLSTMSMTLAGGESGAFSAWVWIPANAVNNSTDGVDIVATSVADNSVTDTAVLTTTAVVPPVYGVVLSGDDSATSLVGITITYTVSLTNSGNTTDTFALSGTGVWSVTLSTYEVTLMPGASTDFAVGVAVPSNAADGAMDVATIMAVSESDSSITDTVHLTTTAVTSIEYGVDLAPDMGLSGAPGSTVTYTVSVTNTSDVNSSVNLTITGTWDTALSESFLVLDAGESTTVLVWVHIPLTATAGISDTATLTAVVGVGRQARALTDTTHLVTSVAGYDVYLPFAALDFTP